MRTKILVSFKKKRQKGNFFDVRVIRTQIVKVRGEHCDQQVHLLQLLENNFGQWSSGQHAHL